MLNAIYASKIFKSSTRQDRIIHAFDNPLNKALVKQLSEYIPDSVDIDEVKDESTQVEDTNPSVESSAESTNTNGAPAPTSSSHGSNVTISVPSSNDEGAIDDRLQEDLAKQESEQQEQVIPSTTTESNLPDESNSDVKQTTRVPVKSAEQILNNVYDSFKYDIEPIKGILNTHADTAGVNRILIKDNEMWIYYNDDINLNNIMPNVIELLRSANYTYLEFNRLARSDNAIVFEIIITSTINVNSLDPSKLGGDNK